jgi:anaerobic dimethyl sulfoxide reductase subunit B (iron-sulfur subunit)
MANQLGFYFDATRCTGCKACQVACKDKSDLPVGVTWRRVAEFVGGSWAKNPDGTYEHTAFAYYTSVACNHCSNAICVTVCPTTALWKRDEDGIVQVDAGKCIGCRYCEWACPYAAPQFSEETGIMTKCNFCVDYIDAGQPPACVAACPSRALEFGEIEELRAKYGSLAEVAPLPEASITDPNLVIRPHKHAQPAEATSGYLANPKEI